ncbi:unnamed protein product [Ectocarpus sp. 13 AM-2016]
MHAHEAGPTSACGRRLAVPTHAAQCRCSARKRQHQVRSAYFSARGSSCLFFSGKSDIDDCNTVIQGFDRKPLDSL